MARSELSFLMKMTLHSLLWQLKFTRENMSLAIWNHLLLTIPPTAGRLLVYGQILPFI